MMSSTSPYVVVYLSPHITCLKNILLSRYIVCTPKNGTEEKTVAILKIEPLEAGGCVLL